MLSSLLDRADRLTDIERQQLEVQLSKLDQVVGGCERILRQPMPRAYNRCAGAGAGAAWLVERAGRKEGPLRWRAGARVRARAPAARARLDRRPAAPVPRCRHTQRFLLLYLTFLPFILFEYFG